MSGRHILLLLLGLACVLQVSGQYKQVCYYTNWAQYRPDPMKFFPEDIDPTLCTHIIFSFCKMEGNRIVPYEWNDEQMYPRILALKNQNSALKVSLAVGGWNMGTVDMSNMLASPANREEFVTTTIDYLRLHNLDGFDLDFEYPGSRGSPPEDKQRFTWLATELRAAFEAEAIATGREPLLLSAAVGCGDETIEAGYEIDLLNAELDWIGLMSYDFNGAWDPVTGFNSPLNAEDPGATEFYQIRSVDWCVNRWLGGGATKDKLLIGQASYGRCFTLENQFNNGLYDTAVRQPSGLYSCDPGTYTRTEGFLAYYEICESYLGAGANVLRPDPYEVPYAYVGNQWVGYDDPTSAARKAKYIGDNGLAGFIYWDLDLDDFKGIRCGQGTNPILKSIVNNLPSGPPSSTTASTTTATPTTTGGTPSTSGGTTSSTSPTATTTDGTSSTSGSTTSGTTPTTTTSATTSTTTSATTSATTSTTSATTTSLPSPCAPTEAPPGEMCNNPDDEGRFYSHHDCTKYYLCNHGVAVEQPCSPGLYWDPNILGCNFGTSLTPERQYDCCLTDPGPSYCPC